MIHVSISAIRLRAYSVVLILTLASTVALAGSMPVSGGGTLNWIDSYPQKNCWVGGQYNYNDHQYGGIFSNAFSYTDVSGHVTNDPNAQLTYSGSPGGASCPRGL